MEIDSSDGGPDIDLIEQETVSDPAETVISTLPSVPADAHVLHIDYVYSPQARLQQWYEGDSDRVSEVAIVHTGYAVDDAQTIERFGESTGLTTRFTYVENPGDLTQVGLQLTKSFDRTDPDSRPAVVCVDSLSLMLQYASVDAVSSFVTESLRLITEHEATARFTLKPAVHDPDTLERLRSLFPE